MAERPVTDCQGWCRYTVPCRRRVRVGLDGRALCAAHRHQEHPRLTPQEIRDPRSRPGRL